MIHTIEQSCRAALALIASRRDVTTGCDTTPSSEEEVPGKPPEPEEEQKELARTRRFQSWASVHYPAQRSVFDVIGAMIKRNAKHAMGAAEAVDLRPCSNMDREYLRDVAYEAVKFAALKFDPQAHGARFEHYAQAAVYSALEDAIEHPMDMTSADAATLAEAFCRMTDRAGFDTPDDEQHRRRARLLAWAAQQGLHTAEYRGLVGLLTERHVPVVRRIAEEIRCPPGITIAPSRIVRAGMIGLVVGVRLYDPGRDDGDIGRFLVSRVTKEAQKFISMAFARSTRLWSKQFGREPDTSSGTERDVVDGVGDIPASEPPAVADAEAPLPEDEPSEGQESDPLAAQRNRFIAWAREETNQPLATLEGLITSVAEKYEKLAPGIANVIQLPMGCRIRRETLRRDALRALRHVAATYDPECGERFTQHATRCIHESLQQSIAAFNRGCRSVET